MQLRPSSFPMVLSVIVSKAWKHPSTFSVIRATHSWLLLVIVFLKIYFVFIYKWCFHKVLNSRSAFQTCQFIVCWPLLFLLRGIFLFVLKVLFLFFSGFFYFSGCLYNFPLCLCFWQFYYEISVLLGFVPPNWFAFSIFLLHFLGILEHRNYVLSIAI